MRMVPQRQAELEDAGKPYHEVDTCKQPFQEYDVMETCIRQLADTVAS